MPGCAYDLQPWVTNTFAYAPGTAVSHGLECNFPGTSLGSGVIAKFAGNRTWVRLAKRHAGQLYQAHVQMLHTSKAAIPLQTDPPTC